MRAIPVRWLIHDATLFDMERDDYGNEQEAFSVHLSRVRFEPCVRRTTDARGEDVQDAAVMYIDARLSQPAGIEPKVGQKILWRGKWYRVAGVSPYEDARGPHHWEATLTDG